MDHFQVMLVQREKHSYDEETTSANLVSTFLQHTDRKTRQIESITVKEISSIMVVLFKDMYFSANASVVKSQVTDLAAHYFEKRAAEHA